MIIDPQIQAWAEEIIASRATSIVRETGVTYETAHAQAEQEYASAHASIGVAP